MQQGAGGEKRQRETLPAPRDPTLRTRLMMRATPRAVGNALWYISGWDVGRSVLGVPFWRFVPNSSTVTFAMVDCRIRVPHDKRVMGYGGINGVSREG